MPERKQTHPIDRLTAFLACCFAAYAALCGWLYYEVTR